MVKLTETATPKAGMKIVTLSKGVEREVPESTMIGEGCWFGSRQIGEHCVIGDGASFGGKLGNNVTIGNDSDIGSIDIPDDTRIGSRVLMSGRIRLPAGITIGNDVVIRGDIEIRPGVTTIPTGWSICYDSTVNPGPDGFPVVIVAPPQFRCNVTASRPGY
jgi:UDP-3-O-[3-hydroxymyristoyl] glucosamine N-acyltransferase